jgi:hypothetical protein
MTTVIRLGWQPDDNMKIVLIITLDVFCYIRENIYSCTIIYIYTEYCFRVLLGILEPFWCEQKLLGLQRTNVNAKR